MIPLETSSWGSLSWQVLLSFRTALQHSLRGTEYASKVGPFCWLKYGAKAGEVSGRRRSTDISGVLANTEGWVVRVSTLPV